MKDAAYSEIAMFVFIFKVKWW